MTPYKGIIRITCTEKKCSPVRRVGFTPTALTQPAAECINCELAKLEILDLEGKVIAEGPEQGRRVESSKLKAESSKPKTTTQKATTEKVTKRPEAPEPVV